MKRLKSGLAKILLVAAGAAAIGLGTVVAVAALVIGLVVAAGARLAVGSRRAEPFSEAKANDTDIVDSELATAS
ncbi:hypothetical protein SAMN04488021_14440 [Paracoccus aminovorans]|uniref:Uncharacterized protein n=1 Tax=Paracoccus aminovorans TaxID=34004 RepID=A0A1I3E3F2_9RHOB|nr:hypothetical protein [Paracoccus aminovorans]CQR84643.1 hypothetical protein JCM7685_0050 [Paracoccus aminovorans]SFH93343.1 hypothetical protein SAMN04488021_14440 [Paracoccus aminovorans]